MHHRKRRFFNTLGFPSAATCLVPDIASAPLLVALGRACCFLRARLWCDVKPGWIDGAAEAEIIDRGGREKVKKRESAGGGNKARERGNKGREGGGREREAER